MDYRCEIITPVGKMDAVSDGERIVGLWFAGQKYRNDEKIAGAEKKQLPIFEELMSWLDIYFSGKEPKNMPPLGPAGSMFRQKVWDMLMDIPYGQTTTYGCLAHRITENTGKKACAQAIGGAVGHNPISILIPCHRVVASDGGLTGYAGGLEVKKYLLKLEQEGIFAGVCKLL